MNKYLVVRVDLNGKSSRLECDGYFECRAFYDNSIRTESYNYLGWFEFSNNDWHIIQKYPS